MDDAHASDRPPDVAPITIASGIKGFVLWLGGSLAGITAVLYACGYLVTRAHLRMLGLYGLIDFNNDYFLQEGSKFLASITYDLGNGAGAWCRSATPYLVVAAIAGLVSARFLRRAWLHASARQWKKTKAATVTRCLVLVVLFIAMAVGTRAYVDASMHRIDTSDLLFSPMPTVAMCEANDSRASPTLSLALRCNSQTPLRDAFAAQAVLCLELAVLSAIAWQVSLPFRRRAWLITPFLALLTTVLLLLPMDYGVLRSPTEYPVVGLTVVSGLQFSPKPLFLLARSGDAFVVWNENTRHLTWLSKGSVLRADVTGTRNLFAPRQPLAQGAGP